MRYWARANGGSVWHAFREKVFRFGAIRLFCVRLATNTNNGQTMILGAGLRNVCVCLRVREWKTKRERRTDIEKWKELCGYTCHVSCTYRHPPFESIALLRNDPNNECCLARRAKREVEEERGPRALI